MAVTEHDRYHLRGLAQDLLAQAMANVSSNNVVVPVLQTFNVLLEADVFENLPQDPDGGKTWAATSIESNGFADLNSGCAPC